MDMNINSNAVKNTEINRGLETGEPQDINFHINRLNQELKAQGRSLGSATVAKPKDWSSDQPLFAGNFLPNTSQYDSTITRGDILDSNRSLSDLRAERQPWYSQIGNNLVNMGTVALTTFADSYIGTAAGLINMAFAHQDPNSNLSAAEQQADRFVNNPVSLFLNSINKTVKEYMPTYQSDEYVQNMSEGKWWKNMGSSGFWGETILENAGFTLGMVASGKVSGSLLNKASKIGEQTNIIRNSVNKALKEGTITGQADDIVNKILAGKHSLKGLDMSGEIAKAVKNINQASALNRNIATAIAVTGEARQEGINSSQEYKERLLGQFESQEGQKELVTKTIYDLYSKNPEMFNVNPLETEDVLGSIKDEYIQVLNNSVEENRQKALIEINDAAARVAGMDFALNFPILYGSTMWQFGKTFSRGYDTQKGFLNNLRGAARQQVNNLELQGAGKIVKEGGEYVVRNTGKDKLLKGLKIASNPIAEANEEMLQSAAQTASERLAGNELNERARDVLSKGNTNSSFYSYKVDPEAEQTQVSKIGTIWNSIIDTYSDPANYLEGFSGLFMGGMGSLNFTFSKNAQGKRNILDGGVWNDYIEMKQENQDLQAAADALNKRLQSPEFTNYYQGLIRHDALENNKTEALEKDDKFAFLNNDHAQLISDIVMFEKAGKLQDLYDNIDSNIEKFSTEDKAEIAEIASELKELSVNPDTGKSLLEGKTDEEIIKESLKFNQELKASVDNYRSIANNLKPLIGDKFTDENEFQEMVFLFSQIDNFESRYDDLHSSLVDKLKNIKNEDFHKNLFTINLDNTEKNLTLAEILDQASPSELTDFIIGKTRQDNKDFDYMKALVTPNEVLVGNIAEIMQTISNIESNTNKRGDLTNQQEREIGKHKETIKQIHKALQQTKERESIIKDLIDLSRIENTRSKLVNTYNRYTGNPIMLTEKLQEDAEKAAVEQDNIINKTVRDELKEAKSLSDVREIVRREVEDKGNKSIDRIVAEMSISDNADFAPIVSEFRKAENLINEVENSEVAKNTSKDIMPGVKQLFDIIKNRSNNYNELSNPTITENDLAALGDTYFPQTKQEIADTLTNILAEVRNRNSKYNNLNNDFKPAPKKEATQLSPEVMDKPISNISTKQLEDENKNTRTSLDVKNDNIITDKVYSNGTFEIDLSEYRSTGNLVEQSNTRYTAAINYLKEHNAFNYVNSGKVNRGDKIHFLAEESYWDALKEGASEEQINWVDNNKPLLLVKEDPNGTIEDNGKKYQIVGTFSDNLNSKIKEELTSKPSSNIVITSGEFSIVKEISELDGTSEVYRVINPSISYHTKQYNTLEDAKRNLGKLSKDPLKEVTTTETKPTKSKISNFSTSVVNVTPGRLSFNNEKLLSSLQGQTPWGDNIDMLFGIATDTGQLETNLDSRDYGVFNITPTNVDYNNSGRLYLLTKSATGDYIPTAVRVKNLGEVDYSTDNELFNALRKSVSNLTKAALSRNDDSINTAVQDLRNFLYVGSKAGISIRLVSNQQGETTDYSLVFDRFKPNSIAPSQQVFVPLGQSVLSVNPNAVSQEDRYQETVTLNEASEINDKILNALSTLKAPFQVNKNNINGKWNVKQSLNYNKVLIDSNILTTNLANNYVRGAYFVMNPLDNKLQEVQNTNKAISASKAKPSTPTVTNSTPELKGKEVKVTMGTFFINDKGEVTTDKGVLVSDKKTVTFVKAQNYLDSLTKEDLEAITFSGNDINIDNVEGVLSTKGFNYYLFPSGVVFNGYNMFPKTSSLAIEVQRLKALREENNQEDDDIGEIEEEVSLFGNTPSEASTKAPTPQKSREGRRPSRSLLLNNNKTSDNLTKEEIQNKINENKDFQKDNCNGIAPN